ncbi:AAEL006289-PA, partial [Aedes aegypti]
KLGSVKLNKQPREQVSVSLNRRSVNPYKTTPKDVRRRGGWSSTASQPGRSREMFVPGSHPDSPDGPCVDAARDVAYCPPDSQHSCDAIFRQHHHFQLPVHLFPPLHGQPLPDPQSQPYFHRTTLRPFRIDPNRRRALVPAQNIITHDEYHRFCDKALETYDLATQCESRRASMRRHTIIGCNQNYKLDHLSSHSMPPSRPASRQSDHESKSQMVVADLVAGSQISSLDTWTKSSLDEHQWKDTFNLNDRLSLTLEEIVHIRSVMTKAELESLPVDVHIKEDVEKRKVCFLCLRTRFTLFARGILCKLCQRTVCSKCNQKMRIPTEHFRNVPVVLLSPSLMSSPCTSNTPSPSHHAHGGCGGSGPQSWSDETFKRTLMERLMPVSEWKTRNTVGSAPSSPKNQRSASSTPGTSLQGESLSLPLSQPVTSATTNGAKESTTSVTNTNGSSRCSIMSRSMEGPHSLPPQSSARPHSNSSTLDRRNRFAKAFTLSAAATAPGTAIDPQKERLTGELMAVCNDCRSLVLEIIRSSRQTRSSAQNQALRNLTLDLSPVYKR